MPNLVTTLLDFILDLLHDPQAAQKFESDPHAAIAQAGLQGVSPADVHSAMQMVGDCSPVSWSGPGGEQHPSHVAGYESPHQGPSHPGPSHPEHGDNHEMAVMQHVEYESHVAYTATNNITYTEVNAQHSIWAGGDANVLFGDNSALNDGNGVAIGNAHGVGPVSVDNSTDHSIHDSFDPANSGNTVSGSGVGIGNSGEVQNTQNTLGDGSAVGNGNHLDNSHPTVGDVTLGNDNIHADGAGGDVGTTAVTTTLTDSPVNLGGSQHVGDTVHAKNAVSGDHAVVDSEDVATGNHDAVGNEDSGNSAIGQGNAVGEDPHAETHVLVHTGNIVTGDGSVGGDESTSSDTYSDNHLLSDNSLLSDNHLLSDNFSNDLSHDAFHPAG